MNTLPCKIPHNLMFLSKNAAPLLVAGPFPLKFLENINCSKGNEPEQRWMNTPNHRQPLVPVLVPNSSSWPCARCPHGTAHYLSFSLGSNMSLLRLAVCSLAGGPLGGEIQVLVRCDVSTTVRPPPACQDKQIVCCILLNAVLSPLLSHIYPYSGEGTNLQGL